MKNRAQKTQNLRNVIQDGWYPIEKGGNSAWVWSQEKSTFRIPEKTQHLELYIYTIYPELKKAEQNIRLSLDGKLYKEYQIIDKHSVIRINCESAGTAALEVDVVKPSDFAVSQDSRPLGICLLQVVSISSDSCLDNSCGPYLEPSCGALSYDLPYDLEAVFKEFKEIGYPPADFLVDIPAFLGFMETADYSGHDYGTNLVEKGLEHFVSTNFLPLNEESKVIDIANHTSRFPVILNRMFGCDVWSNDLIFPSGVRKLNDWHTQIGGDACSLPIPDNFFDLATCHCAFEMFEGDGDSGLIREMERVLKPGGKLVILPLYMNEVFHVMRDPLSTRAPLPEVDDGAELVYRNNFYGLAFARAYSVRAFKERVIEHMQNSTMQIFRVRNLHEVDSSCYLHWIAVFEKRFPYSTLQTPPISG